MARLTVKLKTLDIKLTAQTNVLKKTSQLSSEKLLKTAIKLRINWEHHHSVTWSWSSYAQSSGS